MVDPKRGQPRDHIGAGYDVLADVLRDSRVRVPLPAPSLGVLANALEIYKELDNSVKKS